MSKNIVTRLYQHVSLKRRFQFKFVLVLTVVSAFAEIVSLSSVVPFIAVITQPEKILNFPLMKELASVLNLDPSTNMAGPISIIFVLSAIVAGLLRVLLLKFSIYLSNATGADLSFEMYRRTLYQPYLDHINRSSSSVISGITQKVASATGILAAMITVITSLVLFISIFLALIFIDPLVAGAAFLTFGLSYTAIAMLVKKTLNSNGQIIANQQTNIIKISQEGLGGIRDVILHRRQDYYSHLHQKSITQLTKAIGTNQFITLAPRFFMETVALVLIGLFTFSISGNSELIGSVLPTLGALALGAQRLLPLLQQLYGNYSLVTGSRQSLADVLDLLDVRPPKQLEVFSDKAMSFESGICLDCLSFRYSATSPLILDNLNILIRKGETVGFFGETGSGKSTALDLLLGLMSPDNGKLLVDGKEVNSSNILKWQSILGHVPQHIHLADASIAKNIAFGIPGEHIDYEKVRWAGNKAQMTDFVNKLADGYDAIVGEHGAKLSGGQRQRIGIARALYKKTSVLILDEATNALDSKTEDLVLNSIKSLSSDLTVIIITHRIATLKNCDKIYKFTEGGDCTEVNYNSILDKN